MALIQNRRRFVAGLAAAGAAGLVRAPRALAAEGALETTAVRLLKFPGICIAPQYAAEELLRGEGFTDIRYVDAGPTVELSARVARGEADFTMEFAARAIQTIDKGGAITVLGGVHVGCYELFAREEIRSVLELKGKTVGIEVGGEDQQAFLVAMAAHVGLDPHQDIRWVLPTGNPPVHPLELFAAGKLDAFLALPPEPQELRARHAGHVIFSSALDRPWSQYFCCVLTGNQDYVRKHPVATKRVLRAILKSADLCVSEPLGVARRLVDGGFTERYDYALQTLREVQYDKWREYDPEDTIRYYALRLYETGLIKTNPKKIIAENTDWRFFNELKRELKA
jgi:NitT/TauT family transport system substrate-binding protein